MPGRFTQPQVSKHLRVLAHVDMVRLRVEGRRHMYSLNGEGLLPLVNWLSGFSGLWNERFDRIDTLLAEAEAQAQRDNNQGDPQ